jgi:hypothetical protein
MKHIKLFESFTTAPAEELGWKPLDWNMPTRPGVYSFELNDEHTWEKWVGEFDLGHLEKLKDYLDTEKLCERTVMSLEKSHVDPSYYEYAKNGGDRTLLTPPVIKIVPGQSETSNELLHADFVGQHQEPLGVVSDWDEFFPNTNTMIERLESGIYQVDDIQKYMPQIIDLGIPKRFLEIVESYKGHNPAGSEERRAQHAQKGKGMVDRIAMFKEADRAWKEEYAPFEIRILTFYKMLGTDENPLRAPEGTQEERGARAKRVLARAEKFITPQIEKLKVLIDKFNRLYPDVSPSNPWEQRAGLLQIAQRALLFKRSWEREGGVTFDPSEGAIFDEIFNAELNKNK